MPTFIKTGYWEKIQKGYKGWLNLDDVVSSSVFKTLTINTSGQSTTISNFYPAGTNGQNVYIGNGGLLGSGAGPNSSYNVSLGVNALKNQTTGGYNVAVGWEAGRDLSEGTENILIGWQSGLVITTGYQNIFIGGAAGDAMTTGARNTVVGSSALSANIAGSFNCAFGRNALRFGATGSENTAIGNDTLQNATGNRNTALGYQAATSAITNTNSVFLGANCQPSVNNGVNEIVIGYGAAGNGTNTTVIGNSSTVSTRLHGNLLLGTNANSIYILDVNGTGRFQSDVLIKGSTSNNTATALTVQNSSSTNLFTVRNDGVLGFSSADVGSNVFIRSLSSVNVNEYAFYTSTTLSNASSDKSSFLSFLNFSPTSGTGTLTHIRIGGTINQTGGANGITRGLYVNPTLTSAADFRAIETTNGKIVFGNLPTSSAGLPSGALWNNGGVINIV